MVVYLQKLKLESSLKECKEKYAEEQNQVYIMLFPRCVKKSSEIELYEIINFYQ